LSDVSAASLPGRVTVVGGRDAGGRVQDGIVRLTAASATAPAASAAHASVVVPKAGRIPRPLDRHDVYAAGRPGLLSPVVRHDPARVYVPNSKSATVDVISQGTFRIIDHFAVGGLPQHVVPSWDLRTLLVTTDTGNSL